MSALGLLFLRLIFGGLLAGHGAQKLYGKFGGHGPEGTGQFMEKLGLRPGRDWALVAGASELGGGALTALGLLSPLGPITTMAPMVVAWRKAHWGKPIWVTSGGAELPLTNLAIAGALTLTGPGAVSVDRILGTKAPWWLVALGIAGTAAGVAYALRNEIREAAEEVRARAAAAEVAEPVRAEITELAPEEILSS